MSGKKKLPGGLETAFMAAKVAIDKQGMNLSLLDVREISGVTDYYLIMSGSSTPHLKALYVEIQRILKQDGLYIYRRTGDPEAGWMVLDYFDLVIHIFDEEARAYYGIEELWDQAPKVDIPDQ